MYASKPLSKYNSFDDKKKPDGNYITEKSKNGSSRK